MSSPFMEDRDAEFDKKHSILISAIMYGSLALLELVNVSVATLYLWAMYKILLNSSVRLPAIAWENIFRGVCVLKTLSLLTIAKPTGDNMDELKINYFSIQYVQPLFYTLLCWLISYV